MAEQPETQVTVNERAVLRAVLTNDFTAFNGAIQEAFTRSSDYAVWSDAINDAAEPSGLEGRALSGTVSSLVQKGLLGSDGECVSLTSTGFALAVAQ